MGGKKNTCGCFPVKRKRKKKPTDAARTPLYADQKESLKKKPSPIEDDVTVQTALLPKSSPRESPKLDKPSIKEDSVVSVEVKSEQKEVPLVTNRKSSSSSSSSSRASSQSGSCNSVIEVPKKTIETGAKNTNVTAEITSSANQDDVPKDTNTSEDADAPPKELLQEPISKPNPDITTVSELSADNDVAKKVDPNLKVDHIVEADKVLAPTTAPQLSSPPTAEVNVQRATLEHEDKKDLIEVTKTDSVLSAEEVKISNAASASSRSSASSFEVIDDDVLNEPLVNGSTAEKGSEFEQEISEKDKPPALDVTDGNKSDKTVPEEFKDSNAQLNSSSSSTRTEDFHDASNYSDMYMSSESIPKQSGEHKSSSEKTVAGALIVNEVAIVSTESTLQTTHQELDETSDTSTEKNSPALDKNDSKFLVATGAENEKLELDGLDKINKSEALTATKDNSDVSNRVGGNEGRSNSSSSSSSECHDGDASDYAKHNDVDDHDEKADTSSGDTVSEAEKINLTVHDELHTQTKEEPLEQNDPEVDISQKDEKENTNKEASSHEVKPELLIQENSKTVEITDDSSPKKKELAESSFSENTAENVVNSQTFNGFQSTEADESAVVSKEGVQQKESPNGTTSSTSSDISQADQDKEVIEQETSETTVNEEDLKASGNEQTTIQEECSSEQTPLPKLQRKKREDITFQSGWRKTVKLIDLLSAGIVTEDTAESLESGVLDETEVANNARQYLNGTEPVAGLLIMESGEKMSLHDATKKRIVRRGTAVSLLEAQAATGSIVSPYTGDKMNVEDATKIGLIDKFLQSVLSRAERAACGFKSKLSPTPLSLFEAMKKNLVVESHGIRLLEAQIATGGIIDPRANHRLPVEVAFERGLFDERLNKIIDDPSDETKGFFDPNTNQNLTYTQLLERCITDEETSLKLLPIYKGKQKKDYWKQSV